MPAPTSGGPPPFDPESMQSRIPTERPRDGGWVGRCARTLSGVLRAPGALFLRCPEPIDHSAALRFLATLRLIPWLALVLWLAAEWVASPGRDVAPSRGIDAFLDPALRETLSVWLLLLVPVGMPMLYFVCGLVAHVAVGLTGGASRSVGASMRAVGYAMGPALLGMAVLDAALFTIGLPAMTVVMVIGVSVVVFLRGATLGLANTHQLHVFRALLIALVPAVLLSVVFVGRAALVLEDTPWLPEPPSPYVVP